MNILVTGGNGFIGTNLVEYLKKQGHNVMTIDCRDDEPQHDISQHYLLLKSFMENADMVYHLANIPMHRCSFESPEYVIRNNYVATLNIAEACRETDCKKVVFASSFAVYGKQRAPWTEETPVQATTPYNLSKIQCEMLLYAYHKWYGINAVIVRPTNVFGEHEELHKPLQVVPTWLQNAKVNQPLIVYGENTVRDFTYVGDVVLGMVAAGEKKGFEVYNLCSGIPINLKNLAEEIRRYSNAPVQVRDLPDYETEEWYGSYDKAKRDLGFKITKDIWEWINERKHADEKADAKSRKRI
jgi:UDP-glucuronate 4-epimerase